jgi:hypothetical protein
LRRALSSATRASKCSRNNCWALNTVDQPWFVVRPHAAQETTALLVNKLNSRL